VAQTAQMWSGCRPSDLLALRDPVIAFLMDEALGTRLLVSKLRANAASQSRKGGPGLGKGLRYATEADYGDPYPAERPAMVAA